MGALCYADDVMLLSPTRCAMKKMLDTCCKFSIDYNISFNHTKTKFLYFGTATNTIPFVIDGNTVNPIGSDIHLGHHFGESSFESEIDTTVNKMYFNMNYLLSQFSAADIDVKYRLFKSYCMSAYGCQLWDFSSRLCEKFYTAWRKCIRKLLTVSNRCHSNLLPLLCLDMSIEHQLHVRFVKFVNSCYESSNNIVYTCIREASRNYMSHRCQSLSHICYLYGIDRNSMHVDVSFIKNNFYKHVDQENLYKAFFIRDLIGYKNTMDRCNISNIIDFLCTE